MRAVKRASVRHDVVEVADDDVAALLAAAQRGFDVESREKDDIYWTGGQDGRDYLMETARRS